MMTALGVKNWLAELGNGICNGGPFNTAVCGYDRVCPDWRIEERCRHQWGLG
jgi:hypothetical protein